MHLKNNWNRLKFFQEGSSLIILRKPDSNFEMVEINLFQSSVAFHIETSHLFCSAKQMTGFYMKPTTGLKWINIELEWQCYSFIKVFLIMK